MHPLFRSLKLWIVVVLVICFIASVAAVIFTPPPTQMIGVVCSIVFAVILAVLLDKEFSKFDL